MSASNSRFPAAALPAVACPAAALPAAAEARPEGPVTGAEPGTPLTEIYLPIAADLELVVTEVRRLAASGSPILAEAVGALTRRPGKLLRPALVLLGGLAGPDHSRESLSRGRGERTRARLLAAAVSLELLHLASLTHDDILDQAPLRRGDLTAFQRHGTALALLAGDHLYGKALSQASVAGRRTCRAFCRLVEALVTGQLMELASRGRPLGRAAYLSMITAKTAAFCSEAAGLGALLTGAGGDRIRALRRYGRLLGQAYQLSDDLLDWNGRADDLGKEGLLDARSGYLTFPVLAGLARRPVRVGRAVGRVMGAPPGAGLLPLITALRRELQAAGALDETSRRITALTRMARDALVTLPDGVPRKNLDALAGLLAERRT